MMMQTIEIDNYIQLKSITEDDIPNLIKYISDPTVFANSLVIPNPYTEKEAQDYLDLNRNFEAEHKIQCNWGIHDHQKGFIGGIGLLFDDGIDSHKTKLGYWIGTPFRGQGIMTKVVEKFAQYVMPLYNLVRLEAHVFSDNRASMRVLEKAGFTYEGTLRKFEHKNGKFLDVYCYALVR